MTLQEDSWWHSCQWYPFTVPKMEGGYRAQTPWSGKTLLTGIVISRLWLSILNAASVLRDENSILEQWQTVPSSFDELRLASLISIFQSIKCRFRRGVTWSIVNDFVILAGDGRLTREPNTVESFQKRRHTQNSEQGWFPKPSTWLKASPETWFGDLRGWSYQGPWK